MLAFEGGANSRCAREEDEPASKEEAPFSDRKIQMAHEDSVRVFLT